MNDTCTVKKKKDILRNINDRGTQIQNLISNVFFFFLPSLQIYFRVTVRGEKKNSGVTDREYGSISFAV